MIVQAAITGVGIKAVGNRPWRAPPCPRIELSNRALGRVLEVSLADKDVKRVIREIAREAGYSTQIVSRVWQLMVDAYDADFNWRWWVVGLFSSVRKRSR